MTDFTPENLTEDQVIALLQMLFKNMNQLDSVYYDMFINTNPMDITFDRYDENGTLQHITLPNRAKDRTSVLSGSGSPEGLVEGDIGQLYIDIRNRNLYYKTTSSSLNGWAVILSNFNFRAGIDYVAPSGDGSEIKNINGANVKGAPVEVQYGGTGTNGISGLVKGNGQYSPFTEAVPDLDYLTPNSKKVIADIIYPVGSIYMGTQSTCPIASITGTWVLKSSKLMTSVGGNAPVKGTGSTIGFNNNGGSKYGYMNLYRSSYNEAILSDSAGTRGNIYLTTDGSHSGMVADLSASSININIWERTA